MRRRGICCFALAGTINECFVVDFRQEILMNDGDGGTSVDDYGCSNGLSSPPSHGPVIESGVDSDNRELNVVNRNCNIRMSVCT